jgi:hypothetical protein
MMNLSGTILIIPLLFALLVSGCGQDTMSGDPHIVIEGDNPSKFSISGRGMLDIITVSGPDPERKAPEGAAQTWKDYWVIMPKGEYDLSRFEKLDPITYGKVPEGFEQWVPRSIEVPPLVEGETYSIQLRTKKGPAFSIFFALRDGKIITQDIGRITSLTESPSAQTPLQPPRH